MLKQYVKLTEYYLVQSEYLDDWPLKGMVGSRGGNLLPVVVSMTGGKGEASVGTCVLGGRGGGM